MQKKRRLTKKQKELRRKIVLIAACGVIALGILSVVLAVSSSVYHTFFEKNKVDYEKHFSYQPKIKKEFLTPNVNSRSGKKIKGVKGLVIHYTANPGTDAEANRNYFESRKNKKDRLINKVSSHFIIGLDGEIIQCIPLDEIAYASNQRNCDTVSIECCHPDASGKFNKKTYTSLIQLAMWLCDKYHIDKKHVIRHYDVNGKLCPLYYVNHEDAWKQLKNDIFAESKNQK